MPKNFELYGIVGINLSKQGGISFVCSLSGAQTLLMSPGQNCLSSILKLHVAKCSRVIQNMIRSKMLTTRRTRKHGSMQNVNHTKNSWNVSTAESGRRINLNQPVKKALKYVELLLQVVSSDPLATGHAS